ncbi:N-methyl-L-tryptophan oxidase [Solicola gregarius]|uniref:N-methyl-L-tryptophan oxidase n=1 Tax=Solicola gregarius TaxID=2908642 RepID=A0AA46YJA4_9ACTN|nr:N-methyl-L-tryptophan oxidase [Solicola gregarius]UYM04122.1 N-methyl-L-tryptophan oxidase [Solicola gregarius]
MTTDARVAVIGLGSVGSMALWRASLVSSSVVGFEAASPAHSRSAVGGDTRLFRMTYRDPHPYHPVLTRARTLWRELETDAGMPILHRVGGLSIGAADGSYIPALLESARANGTEHEILDSSEIGRQFPQHAVDDGDVAVYDPNAGYLRTDSAVLGAIHTAQQRGAEVVRDCRIRTIRESVDGVAVSDGERSWTFDRVVVAGGGWSGDLLPTHLREQVYPARIYLTWFHAREPEEFAPERFPIFIRISESMSMYGAPSIDGSTVKATLDGRSQPAEDASDLFRELTHAEVAETRETVQAFFPGLIPDIVRSDAYPDLYTTDRVPLVGAQPGSSRIFLATGCSGAGFKMSPAYASIAVDQALGLDSHPEAGFLSPSRFRAS